MLPAVRDAFTALIDYAGLFPPAQLRMSDAVAEYTHERQGPFSWMLGRFIVPASRIGEMLPLLPEGPPVALSVILDAGADRRHWFTAVQASLREAEELREKRAFVRVDAFETVLPALAAQRETYDATVEQFAALLRQAAFDQPAYAEIPRNARTQALLPASIATLARAKLRLKIRCGGAEAQAFPSPEEVAGFVQTVTAAAVPFKATAGLHHPIRHKDAASGFVMHGFLNLLGATALARSGADSSQLEGILSDEDASNFSFDETGFRWRDLHVDGAGLRRARTHGLVAYGSCSFAEPVEDLIALKLLDGSIPSP